jgi:15-cis-phytoene synthase
MQSETTALVTSPAVDDLRVCRRILARGSRSFALASRILPARAREPAAVVYAFCRVADDAVDLSADPGAAVEILEDRVHELYAGTPIDDPVDRALARVVVDVGIPRTLFDALLEGFAWDAQRRDYASLSELLEYCTRVASPVGVIMTLVMGSRDRHVLARACDLGAAMQLTNIARDVGEDARRGRLYLPRTWMHEVGIDTTAWLRAPSFTPAVGSVVARLLAHADELYERARAGIAGLPPDCRWAIAAAAMIYADIGRVIQARNHDSVSHRARVGAWRKLMLVMTAALRRYDDDTQLPARELAQAQFLIDAARGR